MKIAKSEAKIICLKDKEIRLKAFDFEEKLKKFFTPPNVISMPDEFDPEAPRIIFSTPHGHSILTISQINFSLKTKYDDVYTKNLDKCVDYIKERIDPLFLIFKQFNIKPFYMGLIFDFEESLEDEKSPIDILSSMFLIKEMKFTRNLVDIEVKFTTGIDELFYKNLHFNEYKKYEKESISKPSPALLRMKERGIHIRADINDRFAFNTRKDYETNKEVLPRLIKLMSNSFSEIYEILGEINA